MIERKHAGCGVRTHAYLCTEDLKSSPLTSRANLQMWTTVHIIHNINHDNQTENSLTINHKRDCVGIWENKNLSSSPLSPSPSSWRAAQPLGWSRSANAMVEQRHSLLYLTPDDLRKSSTSRSVYLNNPNGSNSNLSCSEDNDIIDDDEDQTKALIIMTMMIVWRRWLCNYAGSIW